MALADAVTTESLIRALCKERLRFSQKAHSLQFLQRLARNPRLPGARLVEILGAMPPRSRWKRPLPRQRRRDRRCTTPLSMLVHTVLRLRRENAQRDHKWIAKQDQLIAAVRGKLLGHRPQFSFPTPQVKPILKTGSSSEYRLLASYRLEDKVVSSCLARHLREGFDSLFHVNSCAFRPPRWGNPLTHHDAFRKLIAYWYDHCRVQGSETWVAECDIQGFFDCIDHQVVMWAYDRAVQRLPAHRRGDYQGRTRQLLESYLESYDYPKARILARSMLHRKTPGTAVKCRRALLRQFNRVHRNTRYGVPQGGSISCFIANLVLDFADSRVQEVLDESGHQSLYVRYCDDIVILSKDKSTCSRALEAYCDALTRIRLPIHTIKSEPYGKEFWKLKSKDVYLWGRHHPSGVVASPWLAYVGYQLRFDGQIRIRQASLLKEAAKQRATVDAIISHVAPRKGIVQVRRKQRSLIASVMHRLEAMSIGRVLQWEKSGRIRDRCWCSGFACLQDGRLPSKQLVANQQLRWLDRCRNRQVVRAFNQIRSRVNDNAGRAGNVRPTRRQRRYQGFPYSYFGQYRR